jgi:hypothetical protein
VYATPNKLLNTHAATAALLARWNARTFRKGDAIDGDGNASTADSILTAVENGDETALLRVIDQLDDAIESMKSELRTLRMGMLQGMSPDAKALATATGQKLWGDIGRHEEARMAIGKSIVEIRSRKASRTIAKSRGTRVAELRAEQRELRKCADSPDAQKLDEPTQRRLRQALIKVELEIAEALRA